MNTHVTSTDASTYSIHFHVSAGPLTFSMLLSLFLQYFAKYSACLPPGHSMLCLSVSISVLPFVNVCL